MQTLTRFSLILLILGTSACNDTTVSMEFSCLGKDQIVLVGDRAAQCCENTPGPPHALADNYDTLMSQDKCPKPRDIQVLEALPEMDSIRSSIRLNLQNAVSLGRTGGPIPTKKEAIDMLEDGESLPALPEASESGVVPEANFP